MPQRHDLKTRKRRNREQHTATEALNTDQLARELVTRGLASELILDSPRTPRKAPTPYVVTTPLTEGRNHARI